MKKHMHITTKQVLGLLLAVVLVAGIIPLFGNAIYAGTKTKAYYFIGRTDGVYTKVYDGTALTANVEIKDGYIAGDQVQTSLTNSSITHVGTLDLNYDSGYPKVLRAGEDVTSEYNQIQIADSTFASLTPGCKTLEITARDITLASETLTKEYDGTALTDSAKNVTDTTAGIKDKGYVSGEEFIYTFTGSQTFVGSSDNSFTYTTSATAQVSDYNVTTTFGKLTVTGRTSPLTIDVKDQTKVYDGKADLPTTTSAAVTVTGELAKGDRIEVTVSNKDNKIDAGQYGDAIVAEYKIIHDNGDETTTDVTDMYLNVTVNIGDLIITKRDVKITSASDSKAYDGTPLTNDELSITGTGFVEGEGATYTVTGTQTCVGTSSNTFSIAANSGTNLNNYEIETDLGELEVTEAEFIITIDTEIGSGLEFLYDNTNTKVLDTDMYQVEGLVSGEEVVNVTITTNSSNAGTYDEDMYTLSYDIVNAAGVSTKSNYNTTEYKHDVDITKRTITLVAGSTSKTYDGTALTCKTYTVTDGSTEEYKLLAGETVTNVGFTVDSTVTKVGSTSNKIDGYDVTIDKADGSDSSMNYNILTEDGTLTVEQNNTLITITADSNSKMYDGISLSDAGYTVVGGLATGDYFESVTVEGTITHFGTADNVVTSYVIKNQAGEDVTDCYGNIQTANGTLEITKRDVTLTSEDNGKKYDGTSLTDDVVTVSGSGFVSGEGATYTVTGSQTTVGFSSNAFTYILTSNTYSDDYTITTKEGTLTVTPNDAAIVITADSASKTYDGAALTKDSSSYTGTLAAGERLEDIVISGTITDAGTTANKVTSYKIVNAAGEDVTSSYSNIQTVDGTLTITKRDVTLTSASDSKPYDGTALTNSNIAVTGDGFAAGEGATYTVTGSQTVAGSSDNVFTYELNTGTKAGNYNVTTVEGALTVTEAEFIITIDTEIGSGLEFLYDNTNTKVLDTDMYQVEGLVSGEEVVNVTITTNSSNAGTYDEDMYTLSYDIVNAAGVSTKSNYNTTEYKHDVDITKRTITLAADSTSKTYDGTALTCKTYTVTDGSTEEYKLLAGETVANVGFTADSTITHAGSTANKIDDCDVTINKADGSDSSMNYNILTEDGTLTVVQRGVMLKSTSADKYYDGKALQNRQVIVSGFYYDDNGNVVEDTNSGFLQGDGCTYEFTNDNVCINADGNIVAWATSEQIATAYGQTGVGTSKNEFNYNNFTSVYAGSFESDYLIMYGFNQESLGLSKDEQDLFGDLTVWGGPVEITMKDYSWVYNYQAKTNGYKDDGYTVVVTTDEEKTQKVTTEFAHNSESTEIALVGDDTIFVTVSSTPVKHVGEDTQNTATYVIYRNGVDVTSEVEKYYQISISGGELKITPRTVYLYSSSDSKQYDGTALTSNMVTEGVATETTGFIYGEGAVYEVTGSQTEIGSSKNTFAISQLLTDARATDYNFVMSEGSLTVTTNTAVVITASSDSKIYDGTALTCNKFTATGSISAGDYVEAVVEGTITNVGEVANKVTSYKIFNASGEDITSFYGQAVCVDGTLKVSNNNTLVTITADSNSKMYDGTSLTDAGYTVVGDLATGDYFASVTVAGEITHFGTADNVVTSYVIKNQAGEDVTSFYSNIQTVDGTLAITKRDVTLTSASDSKLYDGTALTNSNVAVSGAGFVTGEGATYTVTGSQTAVGSSKNTFTYVCTSCTYADDYAVTTVEGTLTVEQINAQITITADSNSKMYDGASLTDAGYTVVGDLATGDYFESVTVEGTITDAGEVANKVTAYVIKNAAGTDVTSAYSSIQIVDGKLTVTKRNVTLTSASATKKYVGAALTNSNVAVTGDGFAAGEGATYTVTGSQTAAGSSKNTFTYTLNSNTKAANYNITTVEGTLTVNGSSTPTPTPTPSVKTYAITVSTASNGSVIADLEKAEELEVVTLTVKADKDYELETIKVTDKDGAEVELTAVKAGESYTFEMPASEVTVKASFKEVKKVVNNFVDVTENNYYYNAVLWAVENGVTNGVDATHFEPSKYITRAQMVTFLWRAAGCPEASVSDCKFTDVSADAYYYNAVLWAVEKGITNGTTETTFSPNNIITRAQAVTFLWRYEGSIKFTNMTANGPAASPFTDVATNAYYYSAVLWAKAQGITGGTTDTTFSPNSYCTRGQVVTFLYRDMVK